MPSNSTCGVDPIPMHRSARHAPPITVAGQLPTSPAIRERWRLVAWISTCFAVLLIVTPSCAAPSAPSSKTPLPSWAASVQAILAREGTMQPGDVFRIAVARSDLKVSRDGLLLMPRLAYTSWTALMPMGKGGEVMAMGDLVLTPAEVDPVMRRLLQGGMRVTALHNHLEGESPRLMFLHYDGKGYPSALAVTIKEALALTAAPRYETSQELVQEMEPLPADLTAAYEQVQKTLGREG